MKSISRRRFVQAVTSTAAIATSPQWALAAETLAPSSDMMFWFDKPANQ